MKYNQMTRHEVASLARENVHWISTLIRIAKNSPHSETLLDIAEYLTDNQYADFDEMAQAFKQ